MRSKFTLFILSVFIMTICLFFKPSVISADYTLNFLSVGNGDSILVTEGTKPILLIDGGPDYSVDYFLSRYFPFLNCELPYIFLTHPHSDHLVGLLKVMEHCKVHKVYENPIQYDSYLYERWTNIFYKKHMLYGDQQLSKTKIENFTSGSKIEIHDLKVISLYPPKSKLASKVPIKNVNDISMVLLLDYGKLEALLFGDLESESQQFIDMTVYNQYVDPPLEVLKVSHHGAEKSLNKVITSKIMPTIAVISTGPNKYGHPSPTVVSFFEKNGVRVLRADEVGDISIPIQMK